MKSDYYVGFLISFIFHFLIVIVLIGLFPSHLYFNKSLESVNSIPVFTVYETPKELIPQRMQLSSELDKAKIFSKKIEPKKRGIKIEDPAVSLEILQIKNFSEAVIKGELESSDNISKYSQIIRNQVINAWKQPISAVAGMSVELSISMVPSGEIISVEIYKRSKSEAFDRSALVAVANLAFIREVDKIPRPIFDKYFRNFFLVFSPKE